jgi:hypothetical protein
MIRVTRHAVHRYRERVRAVSEDEARVILSSAAIARAADFAGLAHVFVRIAGNFRVAVQDHTVVTVLPAEQYRAQVRRFGKGRFG